MANIEPRTYRIDQLIQHVREGLVRVPRFQRQFVWQRGQVIKLLDSIKHRYPIGTLFLWKTPKRYASFERIGPVALNAAAPPPPAEVAYVLDGHQRISCLVGVLGITDAEAAALQGADRVFLVHYDLNAHEFSHVRYPELHHLPARLLIPSPDDGPVDRLSAWFDERRDATKPNTAERATWDAYRREGFTLQTTFAQYQVRYDDVTRADLDEAVQIFARVNQQGVRARPSDVFAALSWRPDAFDFASRAQTLVESTPGFETLGTEPVLRALLACLGRSPYDRQWTQVLSDNPQLAETFDDLATAFGRAVAFLTDEIGARNARVVPYAMQVVLLTRAFFASPELTDTSRRRLIEWFWASSYGATYGGSGALEIDVHLARLQRLLDGEDLPILPSRAALQPLPQRFHPRSARVRAWHLFLATLHPRDLENGAPIPTPLAGGLVAARAVTDSDQLGARLLVGRACRAPAAALGRALATLFRDQILESHGIPPAAADAFSNADLPTFIDLRFRHLATLERAHAARFVDVPDEVTTVEDAESDSELLPIDGAD